MGKFKPKWALAALLLLSGCARQSAPPIAATPTKAPPVAAMPRDELGREVPLQAPAKRAVILGPGAVEIAFALGAQHNVVARDQAADYPPAAQKLAIAGNYTGPNIEATIALAPDLVIVQGEGYNKVRIEQWQSQLGVPVALVGAPSVADVGHDIERIGAWLGARERAKTLAAPFLQSTKLPADAPTAFVEIERAPQLYTVGAGTLIGDALNRAGFSNAAKVQGYQAYNVENLLVADPRYYIAPSKRSRADELKALRAHPTLSNLSAVKAGRVIVVNPDWLLRPGPRLQLAIEAMRAAKSE